MANNRALATNLADDHRRETMVVYTDISVVHGYSRSRERKPQREVQSLPPFTPPSLSRSSSSSSSFLVLLGEEGITQVERDG